ncbi:MAG TPA: hypothetical protein VN457_05530, partial [Chlamydiales bacterium]|nr:hypothetical protein [Chlamydiales bacterium]
DFLWKNFDIGRRDANEGRHNTSNIAALGFPQAHEPYSRVMLLLFSWDGIKKRTLLQLERRSLRSRISTTAERLDKIITVCRFESTREVPTVSPRDLYFLIFGKDFMYQKFKEQGYTDYEFFRFGMKRNDDQYPREKKVADLEPKAPFFETNIAALDTPYAPPLFSMSSPIKEQYPGQRLLQTVARDLGDADSMKVAKIDPLSFDDGWSAYKQSCEETERAVHPFMLSHFLLGFMKRVARHLSMLYPQCTLDIIDEHLVIRKPDDLIHIDTTIHAASTTGKPVRLFQVDKKHFNRGLWLKSKAEEDAMSCMTDYVRDSLSGTERGYVMWIKEMHLDFSYDGAFLSIEEAEDAIWVTYQRPEKGRDA